jgi:hypothetical protein
MTRLAGLMVVLSLAFAPAAVANGVVPPFGATHVVCKSGCPYSTVTDAVNSSIAGDTIDVMPGTYTEQVSVPVPLIIHGDPGGERPLLTSQSGTTLVIEEGGAGSIVKHIDITAAGFGGDAFLASGRTSAADAAFTSQDGYCAHLLAPGSELGPDVTATRRYGNNQQPCVEATGGGTTLRGLSVSAGGVGAAGGTQGVVLTRGAMLTDSTVTSTEAALTLVDATARRDTLRSGASGLVTAGDGADLVTDSVVTSSHQDAAAVRAYGPHPGKNTTTLRDVTAIATGSGSVGIVAESSSGASGGAVVDARNVVARGDSADVKADPAETPCLTAGCLAGTLEISYSNFVTHSGAVTSPSDPHNQNRDPLFVNGAVGPEADFHIADARSPLIAAGVPDDDSGAADRDGVAHPSPPSIGAYEFVPGPAADPGDQLPATRRDTSAPVFSATSLRPSAFAVDRRGPGEVTVAGRKRGTTFRYTLSEAARVVVTIERRAATRCRKPPRTNRRKKHCKRYVPAGRFAAPGQAGADAHRFSGKIGRRALAPGRYRATLAATDAAGNHSLRSRLAFIIRGGAKR